MTCQECELALAREESSGAVNEHLSACAACRAQAEEMQANSQALRAFATDELPSVRAGVMAEIHAARRMRWDWALAAAAILVVVFAASRMWRIWNTPVPELPPVRIAVAPPEVPIPVEKTRPRRQAPVQHAEPLMVKMLTSDPDVVIYWLIETKEGTE